MLACQTVGLRPVTKWIAISTAPITNGIQVIGETTPPTLDRPRTPATCPPIRNSSAYYSTIALLILGRVSATAGSVSPQLRGHGLVAAAAFSVSDQVRVP